MNNFSYSLFPSDNESYVFMVASNGFLGKSIRFFMRIKNKWLNKSTSNLVNHADLYMNGSVIGAIADGIVSKSLSGMYDDGCKRKIYIYRIPLYIEDKVVLQHYISSKIGTPYEYSNLFNHIYRILYMILFGKEKWLGHTHSHARYRYFCSEFVSTALTEVIPGFSKSPWDDDPMDLKELCDKKLIYVKSIKF